MNENVSSDDKRNTEGNMDDNGASSSMMDDSSSTTQMAIVVGRTRVRCHAGYRGTVAHVGPVASAPLQDCDTIYAGIVWDDPSRGKHNGSVICRTTRQLVQHGFRSTHATAASFVKVSRIDTGRALTVDLLRQKYVDLEDEERVAPNNLLPHTAQTASGKNNKPIELLGELKIRQRQQLKDLTGISLRLAGISSVAAAGPQDPSWQQLRHVQELDLAGNLLWDWKHVWTLLGSQGDHHSCTGLPNLRKLSLASNRLGDWDDNHHQLVYPKLRHLNVNETNIQKISTILALGQVFPSLEELVLANNATNQPKFILEPSCTQQDTHESSRIFSDENHDHDAEDQDCAIHSSQLATVFSHLKFLDCSNCTGLFTNPVQAWSQLPNLQSLSLDSNPDITSFSKRHLTASESDCIHSHSNMLFYPSLQHLQLAGSGISHWNNVLEAWQSLTSLRLRSCPLATQCSRTQILAHLPHLQQLNASTVSRPERREAARWCLWRQQQQTNNSDDDDDDDVVPEAILDYWKAEFPELAAAADRHHRESPTSTTATHQLGSSFRPNELDVINVTIRSMAADSCTREPLIRRLPTQLTVSKIKALCARQFGLDRDLQTLHFCRPNTTGSSSAEDSFPECLECDDQTLAYYGVPDGAELLMNEVDLTEQQRMATIEAEQQLERVQAQERELYEFRERQKRANM